MNDTLPIVQKIYDKLMANKTNEERMLMGFSMNESSRKIVLSTIKDKKNWRVELFLRFYEDDFDEETKEKIKNYLKKSI